MNRPKYLAVDFDDTLCIRESWGNTLIGVPRKDIIDLIEELRKRGWKIILWTCRNGPALEDAIKWCLEHNIRFDYVNENPEAIEWFREVCGITHADWSPKIFADLYIDDSAFNPMQLLRCLHDVDLSETGRIADVIDHVCHERLIGKIKSKVGTSTDV